MIHQYDARGVPRRTGEDADYAALSSNAWADYGDYPGSLRQKGTQWEGQSLTLNFAKHMFSQTVRVSYLYDDAGRLTQKTDPRGVVTTVSCDDLNRPLSIAYSDSTPGATYTYDQGLYGIGRLSSASNSVALTSYTYDKMGRTLQQGKTIGGTTHFFHADHRFTPRVRSGLSGSANQSWDDLPFGEAWQSTGGGSGTQRFTGHLRDSETGNDYAGARHYSSGAGK